jgi:AAA family ATP:ADP antiporter
MMRPLKEALFMRTVGKLYLPYAKIASFALLVPLLLIYAKLVDRFHRYQLFYILCSFYSLVFLAIAYALAHPVIGLANTHIEPTRLLGWFIYLSIESFSAIVCGALFWSFVASTTDTSSAKRGYPLIIAASQIGSLVGPEFAKRGSFFGIPLLIVIIAVAIFVIMLGIRFFVSHNPLFQAIGVKEKEETGPIEGLRLLVTKPYLLGILGVATLSEVVSTILEYQMMFIADETFTSVEKMAAFYSTFIQSLTVLALFFSLVGTSFLMRRFGLTFCLVTFPIAVGGVVILAWTKPGLWIYFASMIIIKALAYSLNLPSKEILYIPTSKDIKFKAKSWIDGFGYRSMKAFGASINIFFATQAALMFYGSIVSLGVVGVWIIIALYVGKTNEQLIESNIIIK